MKKLRHCLLWYGVGVPIITIAYTIICITIIGGAWQRKEGDAPPTASWLENLGWGSRWDFRLDTWASTT